MSKHSGLVVGSPCVVNRDEGGFTLVELLVVIAVIALLMAILLPALTRAKEQGKRAVCLHHLQQLMVAWLMYADSNNDKIVRGDAGEYDDIHPNETPWVLRDYDANNLEERRNAIEKGALYRYAKDLRVYKCPTGQSENIRMYSAVDSMNSVYHPRLNVGPGAVMIKVRQTIRKTYERIVFYDDGCLGDNAKGAFSVHVYKNSDLNRQIWWDAPPIRHGFGSTFSYADGHTELYKWRDKRTGTLNPNQPGNEDMRWFSIGVWGAPPVDRE